MHKSPRLAAWAHRLVLEQFSKSVQFPENQVRLITLLKNMYSHVSTAVQRYCFSLNCANKICFFVIFGWDEGWIVPSLRVRPWDRTSLNAPPPYPLPVPTCRDISPLKAIKRAIKPLFASTRLILGFYSAFTWLRLRFGLPISFVLLPSFCRIFFESFSSRFRDV